MFKLSQFLIIILIGGLGLFSYKLTAALFSDAAASNSNIFAAASTFPISAPISPSPTPTGIANHIVISEVQIDGGSGHADRDFIELYNPTGSSIDINGYILISRTGNSSTDNSIKSFTSSTIIQAHGYYLWASSNDSSFPASIGADTSTTPQLTSSMTVALRNGPINTGTIIDALSWNNGSSTINEGAHAVIPGANQSLERKAYSTSTVTSMTTGADISKGNGFDSDNNNTDFILRPASQPQNSGSAAETP